LLLITKQSLYYYIFWYAFIIENMGALLLVGIRQLLSPSRQKPLFC